MFQLCSLYQTNRGLHSHFSLSSSLEVSLIFLPGGPFSVQSPVGDITVPGPSVEGHTHLCSEEKESPLSNTTHSIS